MTHEGRLALDHGRVADWSVPFQVFQYPTPREGVPFVSVCDLLDLASHGTTREEAVRSMHDVIQAFLEDSLALGSLRGVLARQGWASQGDVQDVEVWIPPRVETELATTAVAG